MENKQWFFRHIAQWCSIYLSANSCCSIANSVVTDTAETQLCDLLTWTVNLWPRKKVWQHITDTTTWHDYLTLDSTHNRSFWRRPDDATNSVKILKEITLLLKYSTENKQVVIDFNNNTAEITTAYDWYNCCIQNSSDDCHYHLPSSHDCSDNGYWKNEITWTENNLQKHTVLP